MTHVINASDYDACHNGEWEIKLHKPKRKVKPAKSVEVRVNSEAFKDSILEIGVEI